MHGIVRAGLKKDTQGLKCPLVLVFAESTPRMPGYAKGQVAPADASEHVQLAATDSAATGPSFNGRAAGVGAAGTKL